MSCPHATSGGPLRPPRQRTGFTLLELVVSMSIFSVLIIGMGSAIFVAARTMPDPNSSLAIKQDAQRVLDELKTELIFAKTVTTATSTEIDFALERSGSTTAIRYVWSGTPGDPLQRQVDGGTLVNVLDAVQSFTLEYETRTMIGLTPPLVEGPEILLASRSPAVDPKDSDVDSGDWIGQYFQPTLAADVVSWRVTRVLIKAKDHGLDDGETLIQLCTADPDKLPSTTVLEQVTMFESDLTNSYTWEEFKYANVAGLAPGSGLCLVLQPVQSKNSAVILTDDSGSGRISSSDGGLNWNIDNGKSMVFYAYGKISTVDIAWDPPSELVSAHSTIDLAGVTSGSLTRTSVMLNNPEQPE